MASTNKFTITLSDKDGRLSADTLKTALDSALQMLRAIEARVFARDVEVRWDVVRVKMRSPLTMTFAPRVKVRGKPRPAYGNRIVKACIQGVKKIEKGSLPPATFSEEALDAAKKLVKSVTADGTTVAFASDGRKKVRLTEKTVQHIDEIVAKARLYVDYSTIEGRVEVVSIHEGNSVFIWETLTRHRIECSFRDDEQFNRAVALLGKRVAVAGRVHYRNHIPRTITVEEPIRMLRDAADLPQPKSIGPIDITGGLSSEDHVRRMRDG
jgi:hypothetical protein